MRIYVFNIKKLFKYAAALIIITCIFSTSGVLALKAVKTVNSGRLLPIYSVDYPEKKVAITFDCAWGADDIPDILKTLKAQNVKATFFIIGEWAEKYPDAVKMIAADGHDVANHSYSHPKMGSLDSSKVREEIQKCNEILEKLSGKKVELFRAPYGDYGNTVIAEAQKLNCYAIQWDVDSLDWKPGITQDEILARVLQKVKNGSIILFHNDTPHTARLLPTIIEALKSQGYGFEPVSKLIYRENYIIDYDGRQKIRSN